MRIRRLSIGSWLRFRLDMVTERIMYRMSSLFEFVLVSGPNVWGGGHCMSKLNAKYGNLSLQ